MIEVIDHRFETDVPELAQEFAARVVAGALKAARAYVPTREDADGKRTHCDVPILDGTLYVGDDLASHIATVQLRFSEMCKKRSPLRAAVEAVEGHVCTLVNYGAANPWIKTHAKNVRTASMGPDGMHLAVAPGLVGLTLALTPSQRRYAEAVRNRITERVRDDLALIHPTPVPDAGDAAVVVLRVNPESGEVTLSDRMETASRLLQLRTRALAPGQTVTAYSDPLGGAVFRLCSETPTYTATQFFRVLEV